MNSLGVTTAVLPGSPQVPYTSPAPVQSPEKDASTSKNRKRSGPQQHLSSLSSSYNAREPQAQATELATQALDSLQSFLPLIIGITIFGASTFSSLVSQLDEPVSRFSLSTVRTFMAIAWILFIVALGVAMFGVTIIKPGSTGAMEKSSLDFLVQEARLVKMLCQLLFIVAFLFLSLVVVAYTGAAGWVAVGLTAFGCLVTLSFWVQWAIKPPSTDPLACD